MTEAPNAVLFFRKQAIFTEKMAASLIREADAGALELLGVSAASPADVPELPRKLPFLPQDRLAAAEPRWVFLFSGADENAGSVHRRADRIKQLLPAPVLRLGRKAGAALLGERNARPWKDYDGWGKPLPRTVSSGGGYDPLGSAGIGPDRVIPGRVLEIPAFRIGAYAQLREQGVTFVSDNCWGGLAYNTMGMEMRSPFINMLIRWEYFSRLLSDLPGHLSQPLVPLRLRKHPMGGAVYPIVALGDVEIHFNHVHTPAELEIAAQQWYRRTARMDPHRVMVETSFASPEIWEERKEFFLSLPYGKIGFAPFLADDENVVYLPCADAFKDGITECARACAKNDLPTPIPYDFLDTYLSLKVSPPKD